MDLDNRITLDCAFRYALGRKTYVTESVSNVIIDCWDALPFSQRERIVAEIKKAIEDDRIGMECDRISWQRIVLLHEATKDSISTNTKNYWKATALDYAKELDSLKSTKKEYTCNNCGMKTTDEMGYICGQCNQDRRFRSSTESVNSPHGKSVNTGQVSASSEDTHSQIQEAIDKDYQVTISGQDKCKLCGHMRELQNRDGCFVYQGTSKACKCKRFVFTNDSALGGKNG